MHLGRALAHHLLLALGIACLAPAFGRAHSAEDLCVVPVHDPADPSLVDRREPWLFLRSRVETSADSPIVSIWPMRGSVWTLTPDRRLQDLGRSISPPAPTSRVESTLRNPRSRAAVPAWQATLVGGGAGLFLVRDGIPAVALEVQPGTGFGDVGQVRTLPGESGAALVNTLDGRLYLLEGEGAPQRVRLIHTYRQNTPHHVMRGQASDWLRDVTTLSGDGRYLVVSTRRSDVLQWRPGVEPVLMTVEMTPDWALSGDVLRVGAPGNELLILRRRHDLDRRSSSILQSSSAESAVRRWLRSGELGVFVSRDGGAPERLIGYRTGEVLPWVITPAPTPGFSYNTMRGGLLVFRPGEPVTQVDLPVPRTALVLTGMSEHLERMVLLADSRLFLLDRALRVSEVPLAEASDDPRSFDLRVIDMPEWDMAIVFLNGRPYALGRAGRLRMIRGAEQLRRSSMPHRLPYQREILFAHAEGISIIANARLSGEGACTPP